MEFDVLIRGGRVVDGSGEPNSRTADVGITDDRVSAIGDLGGSTAGVEIDASDQVVSPGFIDVHIHSEIELLGGAHRHASLFQGVTTQLLAPDGFGWAPLTPAQVRDLWDATIAIYGELPFNPDWPSPESYLSIFEGNTPANVLPQVPHTALRIAAMGWDPRPASPEELEAMRVMTRQWMEAGATCLCLGLDYQPSAYADTHELVELSKVAAEYNGIYAAHIRNNELGRERAWYETMDIGRQANIPVHISHEYITDMTDRLLKESEDICDMTFESYMYPAGCTHLLNLLPIPLQAGGPDAIQARLADPVARGQIQHHLGQRLVSDRQIGHRPVFANTRSGRWIGMSMFEAAEKENLDLGEFALKVFDEEYPEALMIYRRDGGNQSVDEMVRRTIQHPKMMVASDGIYNGPHAHPRGYGCFARAIRKGVRELGAVSLEKAVYKMSGFPAERYRVKERGVLAEGNYADVVIFDPDTVTDHATWDQPRQKPSGFQQVLVNGKTVISGGAPIDALPGTVIR